MSFTLTYDDLVSAIQTWAEDSDSEFVAEIPAIIQRAENRVLRDLDLSIFEQDLGISVSASDRSVSKPTDAIFINEVFLRGQSDLKWLEVSKRSFAYCRLYAPIESTEGVPVYFAEDEDSITLVPTPAATYTTSNARALCTIRPTGLSDSNQSTWLSNNVADLLFQGCMVEAYDYLKHPAKLQEAAQKYQSLLPSMSRELEDTVRRRYKSLNSQEGADS